MSCRRYRSCQSVHNIPKLTIPLPLCFESQSLKRVSADTPSRFPPFSFSYHHLLRFWLSLAFSHPQHISLTLLELANSSNGSCNRHSASTALCTCRSDKLNLLQYDRKIFKLCFIVPRSVSPMLSGMLSMKTQWMTPLMNESSIIKVLPPYKYSNCSLLS